MRPFKILFIFALLLSQACTTITFVTDPADTKTTYSEWHHDWLFGLIEGSDAVDMNQRCQGAGWKTITTEETFIQGLVSGLTRNLYNPHNVEYRCMSVAQTTTPSTPAKKPAKRK